jgi:hypothetical protein
MARKITRKKLITGFLLLAVVVALGTGYAVQRQTSTPSTKYPGTTKQEREETEARKKQLVEENKIKTTPSNDTAAVKQVTPVITTVSKDGNEVTIAAYVPGIFEDGGTCTMNAVKGSSRVTESVEAFANVSTVNCPPFRISLARFSEAGTWEITVSYSSSQASGTSQAKALEL